MTRPRAEEASALPRTRFQERDAERLARELYGLEGTARRLPGERDENFRLSTSGGDFVLKIAGEAEREETLDLQAAALTWLSERAPALPLSRASCRAPEARRPRSPTPPTGAADGCGC